jgi:hypothetical protein
MTDTPVPEEREPNPAEQSATTDPPAQAGEASVEAPPSESPAPAAETNESTPAEAPTTAEPAAPAEAPTAAEPAAPAEAPAAAEPAPAGEPTPVPEAGTRQQPPAQTQSSGRPQRPRRRRLTAAERHRRTFFAKLSELRKAEQAALAGGPEPVDEEAPAPAAEAPADGEQPAAEAPAPAPVPEAPATSPSRSARAQARLVAAIERVGGAEAVLEALQPKRRDDGETMKWSSVCAEQAQGHKPGDPTFTAWVRLAATPVRDVKAIVNPRTRDDDRRGGGRGRGRGGGGGYRGGGGYQGGGGYDRDRGRGRGARREDIESHGRDGSFRSSVRIVMVDADGQRKETDDPQEAIEAAERVAGRNS